MLFKSYLRYFRLSVTWGSTKSKSSKKCEDNKDIFIYNKSEWRNGYYNPVILWLLRIFQS